jgi:hypothetical protein
MFSPLKTLFLLSALLLTPRLASAWNHTGHEIIAEIAWQNLTPQARDQVTKILQSHPQYASLLITSSTPQEDRPHDAFLIAATWPDLVRSVDYSVRYNHPNWHYVDIPYISTDFPAPPPSMPIMAWPTTLPATTNPSSTKPAEPANAAQAFLKSLADLKDPQTPAADRAIALAWVEHLVGDIHQPLHATSWFSPTFPKGDQGGNLLIVKSGDRVTNLHALWDEMLGTQQDLPAAQRQAALILAAHPLPNDAPSEKIDFPTWAHQSFQQAIKTVYLDGKLQFITHDQQTADPKLPVPSLPSDYLDHAQTLSQTNAALAGRRLATLLNTTFSPKN